MLTLPLIYVMAGRTKNVQNDISAIYPDGHTETLFPPMAPFETRRHFTLRSNISHAQRISQIPQGIYFVKKRHLLSVDKRCLFSAKNYLNGAGMEVKKPKSTPFTTIQSLELNARSRCGLLETQTLMSGRKRTHQADL